MRSHDVDDAAAELERLQAQLQIYEAVVVAMEDPQTTLSVILDSPDAGAACRGLQERFGFSELQGLAVMDLQFGRVTAEARARAHEVRRELADIVLDLESGRGRSE